MAKVFNTKDELQTTINRYLKKRDPTLPHISTWDVSKIRDMSNLFANKIISEDTNSLMNDIGNWNVSNVTNMSHMFSGATAFNQPLNWDVSNVKDMSYMFSGATIFNQPLNWNVSNVKNMSSMFFRASSFNQPLNWNVSNVKFMNYMFCLATDFNQPLNWDVSNVTDMIAMFSGATIFNQPLNWNVSNVKNMSSMFSGAKNFNQPLNWIGSDGIERPWNVSNVTDMSSMFANATTFNQNISEWDVTSVTKWDNIYLNCPITPQNSPPKFRQVDQVQVYYAFTDQYRNQETYTYIDVEATQVEKEPESTDLSKAEVTDWIEGTNTNVHQCYTENMKGDDIIFIFNNTCALFTRNQLKNSIVLDGTYVKYACNNEGSLRPDNIITTTPYLSMRSVGLFGLVRLSDIKYVLENTSGIQILHMTVPTIKVKTTVSLNVLLQNANIQSSSHCQAGQDDIVYTIKLATEKSLLPHPSVPEQSIPKPPPVPEPHVHEPPSVSLAPQVRSTRNAQPSDYDMVRSSECSSFGCNISGGKYIRKDFNYIQTKKSKRGTRMRTRKYRKKSRKYRKKSRKTRHH
jgi:surface protein